MAVPNGGTADHIVLNRQFWDEHAAGWHGPLAREQWRKTEATWGLWNIPESKARLFPDDIAGMDAVELGCGTAYASARLARAGARPVGVDISHEQLSTAYAMQQEFDLHFPLILADAERLPLRDSSFDFAISEYGASLWCDPYRWIPEAARVLRPGGRLAVVKRSPLFAQCAIPYTPAGPELLRPQFGLTRYGDAASTEFTIGHGDLFRLLCSSGFVVEDLIELQAPADAPRDFPELSAAWARNWPSEEIWKCRLAAEDPATTEARGSGILER
ncbi:MAG TPA: methyltransferase domain-containing protein [Actinospica sp.]|nr:methyltransferase domain-containing protein [Actinospica sp.]